MQTSGKFEIADERFEFELHDHGPGIGIAPRIVDPGTGTLKLHHIRVHLVRTNDGAERELFMHPADAFVADIRQFILTRLNLELTRYQFDQIPETFDRPHGAADRKCQWC